MRRVAFGLLVASATLAAVAAWLGHERQVAEAEKEAARIELLDDSPPEPGPPSVQPLKMAPSLKGTELDGAIGWNADGSVRLDRALRQRFDHLLSTIGEQSLDQIRAALLRDVSAIATPEQTAKLMACFDRYTAYLAAVTSLPGGATSARLKQLEALRVEKLGAEMARAFFEDDEAEDAWAVERQSILQRTDLSDEARREALSALDAKLPPQQRELATQFQQLRDVDEQTAKFDAEQTDPATRHAMRAKTVGAEAADRLAALDAERAKWSQRLDAFRAERAKVMSNTQLDAAAKEREVESLLQRGFDETEQRRVRALVTQ